jgi:hypothetical protein
MMGCNRAIGDDGVNRVQFAMPQNRSYFPHRAEDSRRGLTYNNTVPKECEIWNDHMLCVNLICENWD